MKILYLGDSDKYGYSFYQYSILKKKYSYVELIDLKKINFLIKSIKKISWHYNPMINDFIVFYFLSKKLKKRYDLIYIHNENLIGNKTIQFLKQLSKQIFFYCPDNPFVERDNQKWKLILKNLKLFDLIIFMQKNRFKFARKFKLKNTVWIPPTFKIKQQKKRKLSKYEINKFKTDVIMIGTWFPERGNLALELIKNKINFKIYGDHWDKFKYFKDFKKYFGKKITNDDLYVKLIQSSKISICLPSKDNNDDITNKSLEIPYIGTLLLAKKTKTHEEIFQNNKEAIFFKNNMECIGIIKKLLINKELRSNIAFNGHKKIINNLDKFSFENNIVKIINKNFYLDNFE